MEWRTCTRYPQYEISENGDVRLAVNHGVYRAGHIRKPYQHTDGGYMCILVTISGVKTKAGYRSKKLALIHQLVAETFHGPRPEGMLACHNDGNKLNNHYTNIRWDTPAKNTADALSHGTFAVGERIAWARFCDEDIRRIREDYLLGATQEDLASVYDSHQASISKIVRREAWRHVA